MYKYIFCPTKVNWLFGLGSTLPIFSKRAWKYNTGWHLFFKGKSYNKVIIYKWWPLNLILRLKKLSLLVISWFKEKSYVTYMNKFLKIKSTICWDSFMKNANNGQVVEKTLRRPYAIFLMRMTCIPSSQMLRLFHS